MTEQLDGLHPWWTLRRGGGPLVATAIHAGHDTRPEVTRLSALADAERRREEDPFTDRWLDMAGTRMVSHRSRFEVDLNRPREQAVYRTPDDAWGLEIWRRPPSQELVDRSLRIYDAFYAALRGLFEDLAESCGKFLVLDLHSYNHRRQGPDAPPAGVAGNPEINIGTGPHPGDGRWRPLVDRFIGELGRQRVGGHRLDVRENVKFQGGHFPRWSHENFAGSVCVLAVEIKKTFMDEWTGEPYPDAISELGDALRVASEAGLEELVDA